MATPPGSSTCLAGYWRASPIITVFTIVPMRWFVTYYVTNRFAYRGLIWRLFDGREIQLEGTNDRSEITRHWSNHEHRRTVRDEAHLMHPADCRHYFAGARTGPPSSSVKVPSKSLFVLFIFIVLLKTAAER
jgi:hypothetical protein